MNIDEVVSVRLYSGPAFEPINNFLRQVSAAAAPKPSRPRARARPAKASTSRGGQVSLVKGDFRRELVQSPTITLAATVGHIASHRIASHRIASHRIASHSIA
jgi:hypothetical protein